MPDLTFNKSVDSEHKEKLTSTLIYANWLSGTAVAGRSVGFEIGTSFVGNGAKIKITGKSTGGERLGKINDVINSNRYVGEFDIPEDIEAGDECYFEVKISKVSLSGESNRIPARPPIEITDISWSAEEARRGDILTLRAEFEDIPTGTDVLFTIYEYDRDEAHDKITELPGTVDSGVAEIQWEYEYHEDTDEIPSQEEMERYGREYNPPEYFFTVTIYGQSFGDENSPGLLTFKDYLELEYIDDEGNPVPDVNYRLRLPDGTEQTSTLDSNGQAIISSTPPGLCIFMIEDEELMQG